MVTLAEEILSLKNEAKTLKSQQSAVKKALKNQRRREKRLKSKIVVNLGVQDLETLLDAARERENARASSSGERPSAS